MELSTYTNIQKPTFPHPLFPVPVRQSAQDRILRHSFKFSLFSSMIASAYCNFGTNPMSFANTTKYFAHKFLIGSCFFYINELVWAFMYQKKEQDEMQKQTRISSWSTALVSTAIALPISITLQYLYFRKPRKNILKYSLVQVLGVCTFCLIFEKTLRKRRQKLLAKGWCKEDEREINQLLSLLSFGNNSDTKV